MNWQNYKWILQERWGQIHPDKSYCWYDPSCVSVENDILHLKTKYNPKEFEVGGMKFNPEFGVGLISCTEKFGYGRFEIEAKLPKGKYLWAAFWGYTWSKESDKPEIDCIEAYSKRWGYWNWFPFWNICSNLHFEGGSIKGKAHQFTWKNPAKHFFKYAFEWDGANVKWFYDGKLVREANEPSLVGTKLNILINNHVQDKTKKTDSDFVVKSFKYEKL